MITQADQDQPTIDGRRQATWDDIKRLGQTVNQLMAENEALTADLTTAQQTAARLEQQAVELDRIQRLAKILRLEDILQDSDQRSELVQALRSMEIVAALQRAVERLIKQRDVAEQTAARLTLELASLERSFSRLSVEYDELTVENAHLRAALEKKA